MRNHFHIILKTKEATEDVIISRKISNLFNAYSKAINKTYHRTGSLFQDRFARKKIENEDYLKQLIIYVHLNPVHHGFIDDHRKYRHSSYQSYLSDRPSKLDREFILSLFDTRENFEYQHQYSKATIERSFLLE